MREHNGNEILVVGRIAVQWNDSSSVPTARPASTDKMTIDAPPIGALPVSRRPSPWPPSRRFSRSGDHGFDGVEKEPAAHHQTNRTAR